MKTRKLGICDKCKKNILIDIESGKLIPECECHLQNKNIVKLNADPFFTETLKIIHKDEDKMTPDYKKLLQIANERDQENELKIIELESKLRFSRASFFAVSALCFLILFVSILT